MVLRSQLQRQASVDCVAHKYVDESIATDFVPVFGDDASLPRDTQNCKQRRTTLPRRNLEIGESKLPAGDGGKFYHLTNSGGQRSNLLANSLLDIGGENEFETPGGLQ